MIPFVVVLNSYGQTGAGSASSKNQKASGSNSVPEEIRTILLPVSARFSMSAPSQPRPRSAWINRNRGACPSI